MENQNIYYVYCWVYEETSIPFYVGKGKGDRWKRKDSKHRSKEFLDIINSNLCKPIILKQGLTDNEAREYEQVVIKSYKDAGYKLINKSNGGDGGTPGWKQSDYIKEKYSQMFKGNSNPNYNNKWSDEKKNMLSRYFIESGSHAGVKNGRCRSVMCVETGEIFDYMKLAIKWLGLKSIQSIVIALKYPQRTAKGYHFVEGSLIDELNTQEKRDHYLQTLLTCPITQ